MAMNRLADQQLDAMNPRTRERALPKGLVRRGEVILLTIASFALFLLAASRLNPLCLKLAPFAMAILILYPYTKRFTALSHLILGLALALAPLGAWIAVTGRVAATPVVLGLAVLLWVAGFDILYALFDLEVDRAQGLHSLPARFGVRAAFAASRLFHAATVVLLVGAGLGLPVGALYWVGVAAVALLLGYEHALVSPRDWTRLNTAFFAMNGVISVVFFAFVLGDALA